MTKSDFSLDVIDNGNILLYKVFWCEAMRNPKKLHEYQIKGLDGAEKITEYHPQVESFIELLSRITR